MESSIATFLNVNQKNSQNYATRLHFHKNYSTQLFSRFLAKHREKPQFENETKVFKFTFSQGFPSRVLFIKLVLGNCCDILKTAE